MNELIAAGFWFLLGFFLASWLSYKAQARKKREAADSFQAAKNEVLRILDSARDLTEIRVTIKDETGELKLETEETPPSKDLH